MEAEENKYTQAEECEFAETMPLNSEQSKKKKTPAVTIAAGAAVAGGATALGAETAINLAGEHIIEPEPAPEPEEPAAVPVRPAHTAVHVEEPAAAEVDITAAQEVAEVVTPDDDTEINPEEVIPAILPDETEGEVEITAEDVDYIVSDDNYTVAETDITDFEGMPLLEEDMADADVNMFISGTDDIDGYPDPDALDEMLTDGPDLDLV